MEKDFETIDALIAKFLAGETSGEEAATLKKWRERSPENEVYFEENKKLLVSIAAVQTKHSVDVDLAWQQVSEKITDGTSVISLNRRRVYLQIAASLLLLACLGLIISWFLNAQPAAPLLVKAGKTSIEKVLPDGSKAFINRNSEISYSENKNGEREIALKGEAFFEVVHNEKQAFVIHVGGVMVKDIGTAFNVKENSENKTVEVFVESGEVSFFSEHNTGIILRKGEKAVYDNATQQFTKIELEGSENTGSFRTKVFEFSNSRLADVIAQLNSVYGANIRLNDPSIGDRQLSVVFNNEELPEILNIIAETLDLEAEHTAGVIVLKDKPVSSE